jgi:hypothetical protein
MPVKGQKIEDPAYLEMLAKAREKANQVRQAKAEEKRKIKLAQQLEHEKAVAEANKKIEAIVAPKQVKAPPEPRVKKTSRKTPAPESETEDESESDTETEEEYEEPPQKPSKPAKVITRPQTAPSAPMHVPVKESPRPNPEPETLPRRPPSHQLTPHQQRVMQAYRSLYN